MKKIILLVILIPISSFSQIINKTLYFDGLNREYIVYLPSNFDNTTSHPVMFSFHGGGGDGLELETEGGVRLGLRRVE